MDSLSHIYRRLGYKEHAKFLKASIPVERIQFTVFEGLEKRDFSIIVTPS